MKLLKKQYQVNGVNYEVVAYYIKSRVNVGDIINAYNGMISVYSTKYGWQNKSTKYLAKIGVIDSLE